MRTREWSITIYLTYAVFSGLLTVAAALRDNPLAAVGFTGVGLLCVRWATRDLKVLECKRRRAARRRAQAPLAPV